MSIKHLVLSDKLETEVSLSQITRASALIQNSKSLDELFVLKAVFNEAEIRARKKGLVEVEQKAIEYKFWVIDKEGALLEQMKTDGERASAGDKERSNSHATTSEKKTLKDLGISKTESSRVQQYHKLPEDQKQEIIEKAKRRVEKVKSSTIDEVLKENIPIVEEQIPESLKIEIYHSDFAKLEIETESIDMILTDPPWGLKYEAEWVKFAEIAPKILKDGAHLVSLMGSLAFEMNFESLRKSGLKFERIICLELNGMHQHLNKYFQEWTPIAVFHKGKCKIEDHYSDRIRDEGTEKKYHEWGQAVDSAQILLRHYSTKGSKIFEPFAGGGSFVKACMLEDRHCLAAEIDPTQYSILKQRFPEGCKN